MMKTEDTNPDCRPDDWNDLRRRLDRRIADLEVRAGREAVGVARSLFNRVTHGTGELAALLAQITVERTVRAAVDHAEADYRREVQERAESKKRDELARAAAEVERATRDDREIDAALAKQRKLNADIADLPLRGRS